MYCVTDIDGCGQYELLSIIGWGSGIYRTNLTAYKYNEDTKAYDKPYNNCWVNNVDFGADLTLVPEKDGTVHLFRADRTAGQLVPTIDYGKLTASIVRRHRDGLLTLDGEKKFVRRSNQRDLFWVDETLNYGLSQPKALDKRG